VRTKRSERFVPPLTFLQLPYSQDFAEADVAVLGIPFDCGTHPTRIGSRLGPNAIREQSELTLELIEDAEPTPLSAMTVIDAGNVNLTPGRIGEAFAEIDAAVDAILNGGCRPLTMGGDGAVTLPQLRALGRHRADVAVLHFDAHTDAYPLLSDDHYDNATTFTQAAREAVIDVRNSIHVGTRAPVNATGTIQFTRQLGYRVEPIEDVKRKGPATLAAELRERLAGRKVYLCFDMDFFDPSVAPGVCTPTPGGATAFEGLQILRGLRGLDIIAADVNTVSPPQDSAGMTAALAATVMVECLELMSAERDSKGR